MAFGNVLANMKCRFIEFPAQRTLVVNAAGALEVGGVALTIPLAGTLVTLDGTQTLTNKTLTSPTLVTPALGTVTSGVISACTSTSMVMVTPILGAATGTSLVLTALTGNLTSPILTVGPVTATHAGNAVVSQAHGVFTGAAATSINGSTQYPANSFILGVNLHITTSFTGTAGVEVGDAADADRWANALAITAGTKTAPTDYTGTVAFWNGAGANVIMADEGANENVASGVAGYTIYYIQMPAITYTP